MTNRTDLPPADEALDLTLGGAARALTCTNAETAKQWVHALSLANIPLACETVEGQLAALTDTDLPARERATVAEILRDLVLYLHTELARRYAGKAQPAIDRELEAAEHALALWSGLWEQYSACLKPLLEGDPELVGVKSKIVQRGLYVGKQLILVHGLARRVVAATVWNELHAYFRLAEILECTGTAVSDELIQNAAGISCYSTYSHAILLGLADPCSMSIKQIELTDRWLAMWARKVFPYPDHREAESPVVVIDLDGGEGAKLLAATAAGPVGESMRYGYPSKLATSVRGRLKRLETGATPAELQLGQECSAEQSATLLSHLDARWYQIPRRLAEPPAVAMEICAGGLPGAHFRLTGRSFDRKSASTRLSFQDAQKLQVLDSIADYDGGREEAEREWPWERWEGVYGVRDAAVTRTSEMKHRWTLDQLATIRSENRIRAGFVTRVALEAPEDLSLALKLWAGFPKALTLLPLLATGSGDPPLLALMLAETSEDKASLILPPRSFNPSRVLRSLDASNVRRFRLTRLLHRGVDFERVAFEETA